MKESIDNNIARSWMLFVSQRDQIFFFGKKTLKPQQKKTQFCLQPALADEKGFHCSASRRLRKCCSPCLRNVFTIIFCNPPFDPEKMLFRWQQKKLPTFYGMWDKHHPVTKGRSFHNNSSILFGNCILNFSHCHFRLLARFICTINRLNRRWILAHFR